MHLIVELLHLGDRTILLEKDLVHVGLRVVSVRHIPIIDTFLQNLLSLARLSLLGQVVHGLGLRHHEVRLDLIRDYSLKGIKFIDVGLRHLWCRGHQVVTTH